MADPAVHEARLRKRELPEDVSLVPQFHDVLGHNRWLLAHAEEQLDTTSLGPEDAAERVAAWVRARL